MTNARSKDPVILDRDALDEVDTFTSLGSAINKKVGADVKVKIGKARAAFLQLKKHLEFQNS